MLFWKVQHYTKYIYIYIYIYTVCQVDAERCDEQLGEEGGLAHTLREIVSKTIPSPPYARYFEQHLQMYLSCLGNYPPR